MSLLNAAKNKNSLRAMRKMAGWNNRCLPQTLGA
jgi:hypothetical protein